MRYLSGHELRSAFVVCVCLLLASGVLYSPNAAAQKFPGEEFGVAFSTSPDRSGGLALNGATVSGDIYVFATPISPLSTIVKVKWYLDTTVSVANIFSIDQVAPYDFQGGTVPLANPFDTTTLADGEHTILLQVVFNGNPRVREVIPATFTVNNSGPPPGLEPFEFGVAETPDRAFAEAALVPDPAGVLEVLFGQLFIFIGETPTCNMALGCVPAENLLPPPDLIESVTFSLTDAATNTETIVNTDTLAPFDLGFITTLGEIGPNEPNPGFNLDALPQGIYTLTATIVFVDAIPDLILARSFVAQPLIAALPPSLMGVEPLEDDQLAEGGPIIDSNDHAIALGKAFFWDLQTGGDGRQACASCHYHAGVDNRILNTGNPGPNGVFDIDSSGPGGTLTSADFNFHQFADPLDRNSAVTRSIDDIVGSQGLLQKDFAGINVGSDADFFTDPVAPDLRFVDSAGTAHRRSTGRNTPTNINAAFNIRNFWDGRANFVFNGQNPFGARDPDAVVYVNSGTGTTSVPVQLRVRFSSLASQSVGPPNEPTEMSFDGRTFPELGRKLLALQPLAKQTIAMDDSVFGVGPLGCLVAGGCASDGVGLAPTYADLIMAAFDPIYWDGDDVEIDGVTYTQMEANFSMFWGLAIQKWEFTLVSDQSKWDRFRSGDAEEQQAKLDVALDLEGRGLQPADADPVTDLLGFPADDILTNEETRGMESFLGGECAACHGGAVLSAATTPFLQGPVPPPELAEQVVERMLMEIDLALLELGQNPPGSMYDIGFYNIAIRPTTEDIGIGGTDPFGNPLSFARQLQSGLHVDEGLSAPIPGASPFPNLLVVDPCLFARSPCASTINAPVAVNGAFKVPTLRNIALTAPFMHNGGHISLTDVVAFYARGADFIDDNIADVDPEVGGIGNLRGNPAGVADLVTFMHTFTDPRVAEEAGVFDHPSILLENGILVEATGIGGGPVLPTFDDRLNGPTARPDSYETDVDVDLVVSAPGLLVNDTDGDGDTVQNPALIAMEGPFFGSLTAIGADGSFTYEPGSGFRGVDGFAYDVETDNSADPRSNVARVTIQVGDDVPVGNPDSYETVVDTPLVATAGGDPAGVLDNDVDDSPLTAVVVTPPPVTEGTLTAFGTDGSFTFTPATGFTGTTTFTYTPNDAGGPGNVTTVTIQVVPDVPVCPNDGVSRLCYSLSADRSDPLLLDGATLSGPVYIFISPLFPVNPPVATLRKAVFWVDIAGPLRGRDKHNADTAAPYDFNDGTVAEGFPFNAGTAPLTSGVHTIRSQLRELVNDPNAPFFEVPPATFTVE